MEIYESEYVTDQEKKEMFKDFYSGRCARRNTGTVPRLYAKESVKTRLSFMKENFSLVLKRVSLKRIRR